MSLILKSSGIASALTIGVLGFSSILLPFFGIGTLTPEIDVYDWAADNEPIQPYFFDMETDAWVNFDISNLLQNTSDFQITYMLEDIWWVRSAQITDRSFEESSFQGHIHPTI